MIILHDTFDELFVDYCCFFNGNEDYFECHEVLEELWKDIAPSEKQHALVSLIQVATSLYHWRRGNFKGAEKSMSSALSLIKANQHSHFIQCFNEQQLMIDCEHALGQMKMKLPFVAFKLVIRNDTLQTLTIKKIKTLDELDENFKINKHTLRDRSEVIAARAQSLVNKNNRAL